MINKDIQRAQNDKLYQIIKSRFKIGDTFASKSELYRQIGLDNLGLPNLEGGEQKKKAKDIVLQYIKIEVIVPKKHPIKIVEIYEIPKYTRKKDGRGKKGVYVDNTVPILVNTLFLEKDTVVITTLEQLAKIIGLLQVDLSYNLNKDKLKEINKKYNRKQYMQFYARAKSTLDQTVYNTLDKLVKDLNIIEYSRHYEITNSSNVRFISDRNDTKIIDDVEKEVLEHFRVKKLIQIMIKNKQNEYYSKVIELINEKYEYNWIRYRKVIKIVINHEKLEEVINEYECSQENLIAMKKKVATHFASFLKNRTEQDYIATNKDAEKKQKEIEQSIDSTNIEDFIKDDKLKEYYNLGIYSKEDILELYSKKNIFRYYDNYLEIQYGIIKYFIGIETEYDELDMKWIDELDV